MEYWGREGMHSVGFVQPWAAVDAETWSTTQGGGEKRGRDHENHASPVSRLWRWLEYWRSCLILSSAFFRRASRERVCAVDCSAIPSEASFNFFAGWRECMWFLLPLYEPKGACSQWGHWKVFVMGGFILFILCY